MIISIIIILIPFSQQAQLSSSSSPARLNFDKIFFHAGPCKGTCPSIDMMIDNNLSIFVHREIWKSMGKIDKSRTGNFMGIIKANVLNRLITELQESDCINLSFPSEFCCDRPLITIILYANGQRKVLKSITPPQKALKLIAFLENLGLDPSLPHTTASVEMDTGLSPE